MARDIAVTSKGDIALSPQGDILLIEDGVLAERQSVLLTLLVNAPDFDVFPEFGTNLEDLLGLDVSDPRTIELAETLVYSSVPDVEDVTCIASNDQNAMTILIYHPDFDRPVTVVFSLDTGIMVGDDAENLLYEAFSEF